LDREDKPRNKRPSGGRAEHQAMESQYLVGHQGAYIADAAINEAKATNQKLDKQLQLTKEQNDLMRRIASLNGPAQVILAPANFN
jgi:hypothetical protein